MAFHPCYLLYYEEMKLAKEFKEANITHTIHLWFIYLHLVDFYRKCK